ncbi:hypothetical protein C5E51_23210 [Nocardia nova]|uniref:DUF6968 family protein n=1 Tax=Nocardia nova TaxID=37330 RepID=UPI000CEA5E33|nr:hypothetical protein [Nocardia nova]PPJ05408.1 hypothetical protein C5E51_23210 [Nocardia nova]
MDWQHDQIARRELQRGDTPVIVTIGRPYQEGISWFCPFRIEGLQNEPFAQAAGGADSVQALYLGMKMIDTVLNSFNADGSITWDGEADLGFPRTSVSGG